MNILYILLGILFLIYFNSTEKENLTDLTYYKNTDLYDKPNQVLQYFEGTNQYAILDTFNNKPLLDDNNYKPISGIDNIFNLHPNKDWNIKKQPNIIAEIKEEGISLQFNHNNNKFNYVGKAYNNYYNQYYLLYERLIEIVSLSQKDKNSFQREMIINEEKDNLHKLDYQIYEYILVKNNKVIYNFSPRMKINANDIVHLSLGVLNIGPYIINF